MRRNTRLPSQPAGENPAGRTRSRNASSTSTSTVRGQRGNRRQSQHTSSPTSAMAGRAHTHASAAVVSSAAPLMSAAGSSASSSVSFLPVTTDGLPLFDPVTGGGRMLPPAPGDDFDDDPTLANITAASSAFDASTMAGGPRRTPERPMPANLEGSMERRGPRRTSAQDQLGFGFEPRRLEGPDQDRINQLDEYRRIQEDCRRLREERDRLADERNRLADERNQSK